MLRVYLFGHLRYSLDDQPQRLHALPMTLPLWGYLLLQRDAVLPRNRLAFLLWPDVPENTARTNLRRHLHDLRNALPPAPEGAPWLLIDNTSVQWNSRAPYWLDVAEFERALALRPPHPDQLAGAAQLYTGALLEELSDDWVIFERERLRGRYLDALRYLVQHHSEQRNLSQAIAYCRQYLQDEPMDEAMVRDLIRLRFEAGDRSGALQEYHRFRDRMQDEMGISPMVETKVLYDRIARQVIQTAPPVAEATITKAPLFNLPAQLTNFVGREQEMAALHALLTTPGGRTRLVTLTGPGGSGKSRLALEIGIRLRNVDPSPFPAGIFYVPLVTLSDSSQVVPLLFSTLGMTETPGRSQLEVLKETLHGRRMLIILDNFEHLLSGTPILEELLHSTPDLVLLVTSQIVLHIYGEQEFPVAPLSLPDLTDLPPVEELARYAAVQLFLARSRVANPTSTLTEANAADIAEICVALDGLPLAIELAAARCRLLDAATLRLRLKDKIAFLQNRDRSTHERHQTIRAMLEWSYQLLSPESRRIFVSLSIFAGTFSLEAAAAVCSETADVLTELEALVDHSLLMPMEPDVDTSPPPNATPRFRMLALIRAFARSLLDTQPDAGTIARRHAAYYTKLAQASYAPMRGSGQMAWRQMLEWDHDNLRAALRWAFSGDVERAVMGLEMAAPLGQFWFLAGHFAEGQCWLREALEKAAAYAPAASTGLTAYALGALVLGQGELRQAQPLFEQALACYLEANHPHGICDAYYSLARLAVRHHEYSEAEQLLQKSLSLAQSLGYTFRIGYIYGLLADICLARDDLDGAETLNMQALRSAREHGNKSGLAFFLTSLGDLARRRGDYDRAETLYLEAMSFAEQLHQKNRVVLLMRGLAYITLHRDTPRRAAALFRECLYLGQELPDTDNFAMCLVGLGSVAVVENEHVRAAHLFGAAQAVLGSLGSQLAPADQIEYDWYTAVARTNLGISSYTYHFEQGRCLTPEAAGLLALDGR